MSGGVFISYRRAESAGFAGRIYDRLTKTLGRENVFIDVDDIPAGLDFVDVLSERVGRCDALVAIIGRNWLASADKDNRRSLDDPDDFVRIEIEAALKRNVPVIPVLVDGAAMPQADDLPDALKKLARLQGIEVSHNRFDYDAERLTGALARIDGDEPARPLKPAASSARWLLPAAALVLIAGGAGFFYDRREAYEEQSRRKEPTFTDVLKTLPPPRTSAIIGLPKPSPTLSETETGKTAESGTSASVGTPDAPTVSQGWMNHDDFQLVYDRQTARNYYPDKVWGRCQNGVPQAGAHWSPVPAGRYLLLHGTSEWDFKTEAADMTAKGYEMQYDNAFQDCDGSQRHLTLWMKQG